MRGSAFCLLLAGVVGCAGSQNIHFVPTDPAQYQSDASLKQAAQLASNECNAIALRVAASVPQQNANIAVADASSSVTINTQASPQPRPLDIGPALDAFDSGVATGAQIAGQRERQALSRATYVACMNKHGFIERGH